MSCPEDNKMQKWKMIRFLENTISNSEDPLLKKTQYFLYMRW